MHITHYNQQLLIMQRECVLWYDWKFLAGENFHFLPPPALVRSTFIL